MPLGGKAIKKREQAAAEKAGIIRDAKVLEKMAKAKPDVHCKICGQVFKLTKKNVDQRNHAASKHPNNTFEECFPEVVAYEAAEAAAGAGGSGSGGGAGTKKKKAVKKENLDDLLGAGLADVPGKKKGTKKK